MATVIATATLGGYELRAVAQSRRDEGVGLQQREFGAARFTTKTKVSRAAWDKVAATADTAGTVFYLLGMPR